MLRTGPGFPASHCRRRRASSGRRLPSSRSCDVPVPRACGRGASAMNFTSTSEVSATRDSGFQLPPISQPTTNRSPGCQTRTWPTVTSSPPSWREYQRPPTCGSMNDSLDRRRADAVRLWPPAIDLRREEVEGFGRRGVDDHGLAHRRDLDRAVHFFFAPRALFAAFISRANEASASPQNSSSQRRSSPRPSGSM